MEQSLRDGLAKHAPNFSSSILTNLRVKTFMTKAKLS